MRQTRVTTETAIPTVFQVELAVAEAGVAEEVGEGDAVDFQEVTSGTVGPIDKTVRVADEVGRVTADLVDDDEVGIRVCVGEEVDEIVDDAEESAVVGSFGGNRTSPMLGNKGLVVAVAVWEVKGMRIVAPVVTGR